MGVLSSRGVQIRLSRDDAAPSLGDNRASGLLSSSVEDAELRSAKEGSVARNMKPQCGFSASGCKKL